MTKNRILYVAAEDPWSEWTGSGVALFTCLELQRRGLLEGAISVAELTARHLHGPAFLHGLEHRVLGKLGVSRRRRMGWESEKQGPVGRVLRRMPSGTAVIYKFLRPDVDMKLDLRRFRYMDISVCDAVRTSSYGFGPCSAAELQREVDRERRSLEHCDGILAPSTYSADSIARDIGFPRAKIVSIGAGPAVRIADVPPLTQDRFAAGKILFVGRDWERKGGPVLLEAFAQVRRRLPHVTLTVVGSSTRPAGDGVDYVPMLDKTRPEGRRRLRDLFTTASLFCMPSVCDTWGLVYVEAAQAGMPIVGYDAWAMPDIVEDGVTGRLTNQQTADGLAAALYDVLSDPARMLAMGHAARRRAIEVLDWPNVIDRALSMLMPEALNGRVPVGLRDPLQSRGACRVSATPTIR